MQAGFAMVEVGHVDSKNTHNILLKVQLKLQSRKWQIPKYIDEPRLFVRTFWTQALVPCFDGS